MLGEYNIFTWLHMWCFEKNLRMIEVGKIKVMPHWRAVIQRNSLFVDDNIYAPLQGVEHSGEGIK